VTLIHSLEAHSIQATLTLQKLGTLLLGPQSLAHSTWVEVGRWRGLESLEVHHKPLPIGHSVDILHRGHNTTLLRGAEAAYEILAYADAHPEVLTYYEKCIIPDECFFQTLFMRGPYRDQRSMNLTYINWGKNRRSPETLTLSDLEKLRKEAKNFCFARKFERGESGALIEKLQEEQE
jgi:hypothetical protein